MSYVNEEEIRKITLSLIGKFDSVNRVKTFMFEDVEKTIVLADMGKGAPNFMIALALCAYTEYWGRLLMGIPKDKSEECFLAFFKELGPKYTKLAQRRDLQYRTKNGKTKSKIYQDVRCGLAHSYMVEGKAYIHLGKELPLDVCGVQYDATTNTYIFNIIPYFKDFKRAINGYLSRLTTKLDTEEIRKFVKALEGKPTLF